MITLINFSRNPNCISDMAMKYTMWYQKGQKGSLCLFWTEGRVREERGKRVLSFFSPSAYVCGGSSFAHINSAEEFSPVKPEPRNLSPFLLRITVGRNGKEERRRETSSSSFYTPANLSFFPLSFQMDDGISSAQIIVVKKTLGRFWHLITSFWAQSNLFASARTMR